MAEVAELPDEQAQVRDFLEQQRLAEEERLRLEEETRLLAEQQAVAATPPPIPQNFLSNPNADAEAAAMQAQFNQQTAPTAFVPGTARQMKGDERYMQEVARAQAGSGFIAPDVGPGGNVITPGYDPELDPRAVLARKEATNLQRNQYVSSLVQGGATYAEALRAALGRYPSVGDPNTLLKAEALALKQNFKPSIVNVGGVPWIESSRGSFKPLQPAQKFVGGKPTPVLRAKEDILKQQISGLRGELKRSASELPLPPERVTAIEADIARKEQERIALFGSPESNPNVDQIGWENMRERFNAPSQAPIPQAAAPTGTETETITITSKEQFNKLPSGSVYVGKDGKKYRKP